MKKLIEKMVMLVALVMLAISTSGCLSYMVMEQSRQKVALRKAIQTNNEAAIRAIRLGDDGVGVGINVLALEALTEQPLKQLGAALGDALIIWGAYEGVQSINGDNNDTSNQDSGRDSNTISVNGNGNDVHVGDETSTQMAAE